MLQITGKYLGSKTETKRPKAGQTWEPFDSTDIALMVERNGRPHVEELQAGRDLDLALLDALEEGEEVTFEVGISAYNTRYGGDYRLNAYALIGSDSVDTGSWVDSVKTEGSYPSAV